MPTALFVSATIVPLTCVPWPMSSVTSSVFQNTFRGDTTVTPSRSGCVRSTPESMTATTTDGSPVVVFQASGTPICARSPWSAYNGSEGAPSAGQSRKLSFASGTTRRTRGSARSVAATSAVSPDSVVTTERIGMDVASLDSTPAMCRLVGATPFQTTISRPS